jgi:hypothetical protein
MRGGGDGWRMRLRWRAIRSTHSRFRNGNWSLLATMERHDLIRFVTSERHEPYGHRTGVLRNASVLWEENALSDIEYAELRELLDWFNEHLARPRRLTASKAPHARRVALSWMRSSALDHVSRIRRVAQIVQSAGIPVAEIRTDRPGYVLYEDKHQVIALPFADTPI